MVLASRVASAQTVTLTVAPEAWPWDVVLDADLGDAVGRIDHATSPGTTRTYR